MPRQNRFVIQHPTQGFYSECTIVGTRKVIETDAIGNDSVHNRHVLAPKFDGRHQASRFGSAQDAQTMMKHEFLQDPDAFAGCTVEPEDDE